MGLRLQIDPHLRIACVRLYKEYDSIITKAQEVGTTQRISISINKDRAKEVAELVTKGTYPSLSAAYDAATAVLLEQEAEKEAWWAETIRRCDEAEQHPERMLDQETFHKLLWDGIAERKKQRRTLRA